LIIRKKNLEDGHFSCYSPAEAPIKPASHSVSQLSYNLKTTRTAAQASKHEIIRNNHCSVSQIIPANGIIDRLKNR